MQVSVQALNRGTTMSETIHEQLVHAVGGEHATRVRHLFLEAAKASSGDAPSLVRDVMGQLAAGVTVRDMVTHRKLREHPSLALQVAHWAWLHVRGQRAAAKVRRDPRGHALGGGNATVVGPHIHTREG